MQDYSQGVYRLPAVERLMVFGGLKNRYVQYQCINLAIWYVICTNWGRIGTGCALLGCSASVFYSLFHK